MKIYIDGLGLFNEIEEADFNATMKVARNEYKDGLIGAQMYVSDKKRVHKFIPILFAKAINRKYGQKEIATA